MIEASEAWGVTGAIHHLAGIRDDPSVCAGLGRQQSRAH